MVMTHSNPGEATPRAGDPMATQGLPLIQKLVAIFWPSFLTAGVATIAFFTAFDPQETFADLGLSRMGAYTIGFFLFWALTASSCALSLFFLKPCDSFNRTR
jgi:hypothetical protein